MLASMDPDLKAHYMTSNICQVLDYGFDSDKSIKTNQSYWAAICANTIRPIKPAKLSFVGHDFFACVAAHRLPDCSVRFTSFSLINIS